MLSSTPATTHNWHLDIDLGSSYSVFTNVTGLTTTSSPIIFKDNGVTGLQVYKMPADPVFTNVILKNGITDNLVLHQWRADVEAFGLRDAAGNSLKKNGTLQLLDSANKVIASFDLIGAWPVYLRLPDLDSSTSTVIALEELGLAVDRLSRIDLTSNKDL